MLRSGPDRRRGRRRAGHRRERDHAPADRRDGAPRSPPRRRPRSRSVRRTRSTGTSSSSSARTSVPASDRVVLQKLLRAEEATIVKPRPKSIPIVVFLVVMAGTIGLAFLLENLRPPVQLVSKAEQGRESVLDRAATPGLAPVNCALDAPRRLTPAPPTRTPRRVRPMIRLPVIPWPHLLGGLILVIMLVPIRRYSLPANLPFQLELYRLVVAALVVGMDRLAARRSPRPASPDGVRGAARRHPRQRDRVDRREPGAGGGDVRRGEQGS